VVLIFAFIHARIPSAKELILHFLLIFIVFYLSWNNYVGRTGKKAINFATEHVENIQRNIQENHEFILPSTFVKVVNQQKKNI